MKRRGVAVVLFLASLLVVYRVVLLVAQEMGGLSQEKIRVSVVDSWSLAGSASPFPLDVTLAKDQNYEFLIEEDGGRIIAWEKLNSDVFPDRETIYLRIIGGAKPGKFKLKVRSGEIVLREAEFRWGLVGMNFMQTPLEVGTSNTVYLATCEKDPEVNLDGKKIDLIKVDNCYWSFEFVPAGVGSAIFKVRVVDVEKDFSVSIEDKPKIVFKRNMEKSVMSFEYLNSDKVGFIKELKPDGVGFNEAGDVETRKEMGRLYFMWKGSGTYKLSTVNTDWMVPIGPASFWENSVRKYFEETTTDSQKKWEEAQGWLVPGSILEEARGQTDTLTANNNRVELGNVAFEINNKTSGFEVSYFNLQAQAGGSYDYDPETSMEDAPLLFGHYKVLIKNGLMYVYEVITRREEDVEKFDYKQVYP